MISSIYLFFVIFKITDEIFQVLGKQADDKEK